MKYLLFYKPYNVLSQFTPNINNTTPTKTLKDYINQPDIYTVGRLDRDSEGLLLLTNDGKMQHRLSNPKFEHLRTYLVQVERIPDNSAIHQLQTGVMIQNYLTRQAHVKLLLNEPDIPPRQPPIRYRQNVPTAWLEITLTEGKNRQVRRMTAAVGFPTLRLIRVKIGNLTIDNLQPGEYRPLTPDEINKLMLK